MERIVSKVCPANLPILEREKMLHVNFLILKFTYSCARTYSHFVVTPRGSLIRKINGVIRPW